MDTTRAKRKEQGLEDIIGLGIHHKEQRSIQVHLSVFEIHLFGQENDMLELWKLLGQELGQLPKET